MASPRGDSETQRSRSFGELLRELRTQRNESLRTVGERVPMTDSNLSRIERGKQGPPSDDTIRRLAAALEADPAEMLRAAGRLAGESDFEQSMRTELDLLRREVGAISEQLGAMAQDIREIKKAPGRQTSS
jgi:transcriptional regulator with XRE-family HTH domain